MGLLDDAIREHLELKRLRGADLGLVAREESEAFGPVRCDEPDGGGEVAAPDDVGGEDVPATGHASAQSEGFSNVGQETAELDMRTVLEEVADRDISPVEPVAVGPVAARPPASGAHEHGATEDSLEWEMPGDGGSGGAAGHGGGDRHATDAGDLEGDGTEDRPGEPVEDVLEETPDFLRDTPEQERLWFEQRPPRDFDFDK